MFDTCLDKRKILKAQQCCTKSCIPQLHKLKMLLTITLIYIVSQDSNFQTDTCGCRVTDGVTLGDHDAHSATTKCAVGAHDRTAHTYVSEQPLVSSEHI